MSTVQSSPAAGRGGSPTFVGEFKDGTTVRMTTWHDPGAKVFNLARGIGNAKAACQSRHRTNAVPPLIEGHFERNGEVLETYTAEHLNAVQLTDAKDEIEQQLGTLNEKADVDEVIEATIEKPTSRKPKKKKGGT
jgi:hypothetical protein